jgi:hypothetical protein
MKNSFKNAGLAIVMALGFSQLSNANVTIDCESGNRGIEQAACWGFGVTGYYNLATLLISGKDVNIVRNTPGTPPSMISLDANTPATSEVATVEVPNFDEKKPEQVVYLSQYFDATYLSLHAELTALITQREALKNPKEEFALYTPIKDFIGQTEVKESNLSSNPEIIMAIDHRKKFGQITEGQPMPEWFNKKAELLAKKFAFFYASHKKLEDFGMDMDYLTMPSSIDLSLITPDDLLRFPILQSLKEYDELLSKYPGVSTVGKLGRELKIDGVELYNLWKELTKQGVVKDYEWRQETNQIKNSAQLTNLDDKTSINDFLISHPNYSYVDGTLTVTGKMTYSELTELKVIFTSEVEKTALNEVMQRSQDQLITKISKKWLEISTDVNVKRLVGKLDLSDNFNKDQKELLIAYLETLSKGKKMDDSFLSVYVRQRMVYKSQALFHCYKQGSYDAISLASELLDDATTFKSEFETKFKEWIQQYDNFEEVALGIINKFQVAKEEDMSFRLTFTDDLLKKKIKDFKGDNIPVGQEFLFRLLEENNNLPPEVVKAAAYEVIYK